MDIATGTGFLAGHMSQHFEKIIGVDLSEEQLKAASEKYKDETNISFK